jgi:hypothetical protein
VRLTKRSNGEQFAKSITGHRKESSEKVEKSLILPVSTPWRPVHK